MSRQATLLLELQKSSQEIILQRRSSRAVDVGCCLPAGNALQCTVNRTGGEIRRDTMTGRKRVLGLKSYRGYSAQRLNVVDCVKILNNCVI